MGTKRGKGAKKVKGVKRAQLLRQVHDKNSRGKAFVGATLKRLEREQLERKLRTASAPYSPDEDVLLVGEGDFSFARGLVRAWTAEQNSSKSRDKKQTKKKNNTSNEPVTPDKPTNITHPNFDRLVATCLDEQEVLIEKYPHSAAILQEIIPLGVRVITGVDACKMHARKTAAPASSKADSIEQVNEDWKLDMSRTPGRSVGRGKSLLVPAWVKAAAAADKLKKQSGRGGVPGSVGGSLSAGSKDDPTNNHWWDDEEAEGDDDETMYENASDNLLLLKGQNGFDKIVFNFPHLGSGEGDKVKNRAQHRELLIGFLNSAQGLLRDDKSEIHVTLKRGDPYDSWEVGKLAGKERVMGLRTKTVKDFLPAVFPGYQHRRTLGAAYKKPDEGGPQANADIAIGARTYVFVLASKHDPDADTTTKTSKKEGKMVKGKLMKGSKKRKGISNKRVSVKKSRGDDDDDSD
jgi:hypothetical protein